MGRHQLVQVHLQVIPDPGDIALVVIGEHRDRALAVHPANP
jgi:hypothetical protein